MKGSKKKTTQLTLFSSMKRVTKSPSTDSSRKGKAEVGKRDPAVQVAGALLPTADSNLSCKDDSADFQEHLPIDISPLKNHADANVDCNMVPLGVGSEEPVSDNEGDFSFENGGTKKQKQVMEVFVKPEILEQKDSTSQEIDIEYRTDSLTGVKLESCEMTETDIVKFEGLCICTCHFAPVNSDTPESVLQDSLLDANEDDSSVHMHGVVQEEASSDSSVVISSFNTRIVGRKFSGGAVCEEGMQLSFVRDADNAKDSNAVKVCA